MRRLVILLAVLAAWPAAGNHPARALPPGDDVLPVVAVADVDSLLGQEHFVLAGWVHVVRGDARVEHGRQLVPLEIARAQLRGASRLGLVVVTEREAEASRGELRSLERGAEFPASSQFDFVADVSVPESPFGALRLRPETPLRLAPDEPLTSWPPLGVTYTLRLPASADCMPLIEVQEVPSEIGLCLRGLSLSFAPELPSFSVAGGEGARHHPADILSLVPPDVSGAGQLPYARIPCANLGLTADGCDDGADGDQDDLDGLSFGDDGRAEGAALVEFSVAPGAQGLPGSAVDVQIGCPPADPGISPEPESDVFSSGLDGANKLLFDGNGPVGACTSAFPLGLLESIAAREDLDALDGRDVAAVDPDGDGVPQRPVYFSLRAGSPSLAAVGVSPAGVLVTSHGAAPAVYASAASLGLAPGDDLDALCLREDGDGAFGAGDLLYFSLAPGSPSLATAGAGPGDLLSPAVPPVVARSAATLGLVASDDVDAIACETTLEPVAGDTNCDGRVDSVDAALLLQLAARLLDRLPCPASADVNRDGALDTLDAMLVLQFHARLLSSLPV